MRWWNDDYSLCCFRAICLVNRVCIRWWIICVMNNINGQACVCVCVCVLEFMGECEYECESLCLCWRDYKKKWIELFCWLAPTDCHCYLWVSRQIGRLQIQMSSKCIDSSFYLLSFESCSRIVNGFLFLVLNQILSYPTNRTLGCDGRNCCGNEFWGRELVWPPFDSDGLLFDAGCSSSSSEVGGAGGGSL